MFYCMFYFACDRSFSGIARSLRAINQLPYSVHQARLLLGWVTDCLRPGTPPRYVTSHQLNSAFYPSGVGKSSINLFGWG